MRASVLAIASLTAVAMTPALAKDASPDNIKGLYLTTDFPALEIHAGEETTLPLTVYNYGLPPQRAALSVADKPTSWKTEIEGDGKPVGAAFVDYDGRASLNLKLEIPADAKPGAYEVTLNADGDAAKSSLPIAITLDPPLAAKLTATPKFPVLRGSPKSSFDFTVTVKNDSANDAVVSLAAKTPDGFETTFKQGYGSQEITSVPIKAGASKDISVSVKPSPEAAAGKVPVMFEAIGQKARAETKLTLDIGGEPSLSIAGEGDRLSGSAYAGKPRSLPFTISNTGTAPAREVSLTASPPSGWSVTFEPKKIASIAPGGEAKVTADLTPSVKAIAGDYMVDVDANGEGVSNSVSYRVTVLTSTLWGVTGLGVIGAALLVLVGAVGRFGRR